MIWSASAARCSSLIKGLGPDILNKERAKNLKIKKQKTKKQTNKILGLFSAMFIIDRASLLLFLEAGLWKLKRKSLHSMLFQVYWSDSGNVKKKKKMVF